MCELRSTRLTIGDRVGIFSRENRLVAIGIVKEIKGTSRLIEIQKSWGTIFRSHRARRIEDNAAANPEKFFTIQKPVAEKLGGASLGMFSMGVGDGVVASNIEGQYFRHWKNQIYWLVKGNYFSGSGNASDHLKSVPVQPITVSVLGLTGGMTKVFLPYSPFAIYAGLDAGLAIVNASIGGGFDVAQVLNRRIEPGNGLMFRGHADVVMQRDGLQPRVGVAFLQIQKSSSFGLSIGLSKAL